MKFDQANISNLNLEIEIAASPDKVWTSLTKNISEWWPAEFYIGGESGSRNFHLETSPGGRMFETWDDGGSALWGTVVTVKPNKQLQVLGSIFPNWGGPSQWFGTWDLVANGEKTMLRYSEHAIGRSSEAGNLEKEKGWQFLWSALKANVEGAPAPTWVD